ncbi:MAG: preprotein translocase subunit SecE [Leptospirales bacterium]
MTRILRFLREARTELKKVSWPSTEDVSRSTVVVVITVIFFTFFVYFADKVINFILQKVLG